MFSIDEDHRQLPDRREVHRLVEVAFARAAVADERRRDARLVAQLRGEAEAVGDRQHRRQMADHADDVVVEQAEMEGAIASAGEAAFLEQELAEQPLEVDAARREDAEVAVQRQDEVVVLAAQR